MTLRTGMFTGKDAPKKKKKVSTGKRVLAPKGTGQTFLRLALDNHLEDKRPLWKPPSDGGWHPSSLGEVCDRRSILKMLGWRGDPIAQKLKRIFEMGHAVEEIWRRDFQKMGLLLSSNVRIPDPVAPAISGEYDVIIRHPYEPNRKLLGEIKSINDRGFKLLPPLTLDPEINFSGIMENTSDIGSRIRGYMMQFQTYLRLTKMDEGFILFDNKNDSEYNDYLLVYSPELIDTVTTRLLRLEPYRPALMVPACTCGGKHEGPCLYKTDYDIPLSEIKIFLEDSVV